MPELAELKNQSELSLSFEGSGIILVGSSEKTTPASSESRPEGETNASSESEPKAEKNAVDIFLDGLCIEKDYFLPQTGCREA